MNVIEEFEEVLTLDQAQELADFDPTSVVERDLPTQQLLDELLGRFDEDDSLVFLAHGLTHELHHDSDD
jgi:hypothetical protein